MHQTPPTHISSKEEFEALVHNLLTELNPSRVTLENQSHQHAGHGPEHQWSHYKILIVSDFFTSLSRVQRHKSIYRLLAPCLTLGLHALSLETLTPQEYDTKYGHTY